MHIYLSLALSGTQLTLETLGKAVKYVQSYQLNHQNNFNSIVLVFLQLTFNISYIFF